MKLDGRWFLLAAVSLEANMVPVQHTVMLDGRWFMCSSCDVAWKMVPVSQL
jgi:hypothetical protein